MAAKSSPTHMPPRSVRVPDELWDAARYLTTVHECAISDVINIALAEWVLDAMTAPDDQVNPLDKEALRRRIPETELRRIILHRTTMQRRSESYYTADDDGNDVPDPTE